MAVNVIPFPVPAEKSASGTALSTLELHAPAFRGLEATATCLEIRLALAEYRERHGADHWRLFDMQVGRA